MMTISKDEYIRLQPYWDFQRKKEYNKEQLKYACSHVASVDGNIFFEQMWVMFEEKDYQDPPLSWVPKDEKFRIEGE